MDIFHKTRLAGSFAIARLCYLGLLSEMLLLSSCSFFNQPAAAPEAIGSIEESTTPPTEVTTAKINELKPVDDSWSDVELLWDIPNSPVDGYQINYGYDRENLQFKVQVYTNQLETKHDEKLGTVYRHVLDNIPHNKKIFFSIQAFNGKTYSAPTPVMELEAA